jgi:Flp pilus assembly protein TadD
MSSSVRQVLIAAACLLALAGCNTTDLFKSKFSEPLPDPLAPQASAATPDPAPTGSVATALASSPPANPELLGADPNDDVSIGKKYFRQGSYGVAERHFRKAVELHPRDAEAWVGLAASYDRLRRFDLADRAYTNAIKIAGATPEILNNQGFSYMLRGDYARARVTLLAAQAKDPTNPYIANNLSLLAESAKKRKAVN